MYDLPIVNLLSPNHEDLICNRDVILRIEQKKKLSKITELNLSSMKTGGMNVYCIIRSSWVD